MQGCFQKLWHEKRFCQILEATINVAKQKEVDKSVPEAVEIQDAYYKVLDEILKNCKQQAKEIGSKNVSFDYLKDLISVIISNFKIGMKK